MRSSELRPQPEDFDFDLKRALQSVVSVTTQIPEDAMTADILGTERMGNGVVIRDNIVLTIGYLVTEAETVWLTSGEVTTPGHVLGYDQATGFGLIQALGQLNLPALTLGDSDASRIGDSVVVAGAGGLDHAVAAHIVAKQEFAGYWEYLLDEATGKSDSKLRGRAARQQLRFEDSLQVSTAYTAKLGAASDPAAADAHCARGVTLQQVRWIRAVAQNNRNDAFAVDQSLVDLHVERWLDELVYEPPHELV